MDLATIKGALASIKTVADIASGFSKLSDKTEFTIQISELTSAIIDLQSKMLSIQQDFSQLLSEKDDLERKLKSIDEWSDIQEKYTLVELEKGKFVYTLRRSDAGEPNHFLCPNCFAEKRKSILQNVNAGYHLCPKCKHSTIIGAHKFYR